MSITYLMHNLYIYVQHALHLSVFIRVLASISNTLEYVLTFTTFKTELVSHIFLP